MSSPLASLVRAYDRMAERGEVPPFGYSMEKIGFVISLNEDGTPAGIADLRSSDGRKRLPRPMEVPQPEKRTAGIAPNFLWDKTSYVLGVTAGEGKRLADEHAAFVKHHNDTLSGTDDTGLRALLAFLALWTPTQFDALGWPEEMKDQNVVFALEAERLGDVFIHSRPLARRLWERLSCRSGKSEAACLITGERAPVQRLHPSIKGVWGAQSAGASIVSFNLDAFTSYGHEQGDNAPVSEGAAFAYTAALNKFLTPGSHNRIQIGDASTVYWADGGDAENAELAEDAFSGIFDEPDETVEAQKVRAILAKIRNAQRVEDFRPDLPQGVRFHVLGLAPNAARLSIRFWYEDDFGQLAENYWNFVRDIRIEPPPHRNPNPPLWQYLAETAVLGKRDNIPPNLAGEWMRAILTGTRYPLTLLANVLMRIRADGSVNALRASMLKAVLNRNSRQFKGKVPVALDISNNAKGYVLGRLFAVYEQIQSAALGRNVNATIKDKFYGSASAQPRKVFALLDKGSAVHLSKVGKHSHGHRVNLEKLISGIMEMMSPAEDPFPASLSSEQQALFALGYYHQRSEFFKSRKNENNEESAHGHAG
jgi:CRISPR-associated protein Csd1